MLFRSKSGERRISVGWPATGLSNSSASVWANRFLASSSKSRLFVPSPITASQGVAPSQRPVSLTNAFSGRITSILPAHGGGSPGASPTVGRPHHASWQFSPGATLLARGYILDGVALPDGVATLDGVLPVRLCGPVTRFLPDKKYFPVTISRAYILPLMKMVSAREQL